MSLVADTHALVWYLEKSSELSQIARVALHNTEQSTGNIYVASISLIEIIYLVEKGRLPQASYDRVLNVLQDQTTAFTLINLDLEVAETLKQIPRSSVPDMPDRIIAATAAYLGLPLVTRDMKIQSANLQTIW